MPSSVGRFLLVRVIVAPRCPASLPSGHCTLEFDLLHVWCCLSDAIIRGEALSKALTEDELVYLRTQFMLLEPNQDGRISLDNFKMALVRNATDAMKASRVPDILSAMAPLSYRKMDFEEFCAAAISTYQLEALEGWEQIASTAFEHFEREGNRIISVEELAQELNVGPTSYSILKDWIRGSDSKLSLLGYTKFLHGVTLRSSNTRQR
ncbi:calcium-dependent protein kinase (CDPK) family protein [Actinidia rufa]|uniref:Calcium-dependent protein kinase (CDPK) family protein n=1 Tax=Actinidia rufa TaxID=165716 RepID=A0A7J0E4Y0_9ERIC|nr:calcium-dependent protein kinase (CDPK) family protein [Actinidia rufa]